MNNFTIASSPIHSKVEAIKELAPERDQPKLNYFLGYLNQVIRLDTQGGDQRLVPQPSETADARENAAPDFEKYFVGRQIFYEALEKYQINQSFDDLKDKINEADGLVFEDASVKKINLSGKTLENITFKNVDFENVDFTGAVIKNCKFKSCVIDYDCDFTNAEVLNNQFINCDELYFHHTKGLKFKSNTIEQSEFNLFVGNGLVCNDNDCSQASSIEIQVENHFNGSADLQNNNFARPLSSLPPEILPFHCNNIDFSGSNFSGSKHTGGINYPLKRTNCNFANCNFKGAKFWCVDFSGSDLRGCNFTDADFMSVDLRGCNLSDSLGNAKRLYVKLDFEDIIAQQNYLDAQTIYKILLSASEIDISEDAIGQDQTIQFDILDGQDIRKPYGSLDVLTRPIYYSEQISNENTPQAILKLLESVKPESVSILLDSFQKFDDNKLALMNSLYSLSKLMEKYPEAKISQTIKNVVNSDFIDKAFSPNQQGLLAKIAPGIVGINHDEDSRNFSIELDDVLLELFKPVIDDHNNGKHFSMLQGIIAQILPDVVEYLFSDDNLCKEFNMQVFERFKNTLKPAERNTLNRIISILNHPELSDGLPRVDYLVNMQTSSEGEFTTLPESAIQSPAFILTSDSRDKLISTILAPAELYPQLINPESEFNYLIPEFRAKALEPYQHEGHKYRHLLEHSFKVYEKVAETALYKSLDRNKQLILALAALTHDLTKSTSSELDKVKYDPAHAIYAPKLAYQIADRLNLSHYQKTTLAKIIHFKELFTKLTEVENYEALTPKQLKEFAIEIGSEENLNMIFALAAADSFRVKDNSEYWDRFGTNRDTLINNLKPYIKYHELLTYPLMNDFPSLKQDSEPEFVSWKGDKDGNYKSVELIKIPSDQDYNLMLHLTDELNLEGNSIVFNRNSFETDSFPSFSFCSVNYPRLYQRDSHGDSPLIFENKPVVVYPQNTGSGCSKTLRSSLKEAYNCETKGMDELINEYAVYKFDLIQKLVLGWNDANRIDSQKIVDYYQTNLNRDSETTQDFDEDFIYKLKDIERVSKLMDDYKNYGFEDQSDQNVLTEEQYKVINCVNTLTKLMALLDSAGFECLRKKGYRGIEELQAETKNNEINAIDNELKGMLLLISAEDYQKPSEELREMYSREFEFANKHNIPIVVKSKTESSQVPS